MVKKSQIKKLQIRKTQIEKSQIKKSKTERNILVAFLLNLSFSIYEFIGGTFTNSTAITSDAIHDLGDAFSIGISYILEHKSKHQPDKNYTYGYARLSLLGGMITALILVLGSIFAIINALQHIIEPATINYDGMIVLAIIGTIVNFIATRITHTGNSLNQKSVNLHMLEDVLGWVIVLIGAIIMRWTNFILIDPILSILVAIFILKHAWDNFHQIITVLLEKTPAQISIAELKNHLLTLNGIHHSTIELESPDEHCHDTICHPNTQQSTPHAHHH